MALIGVLPFRIETRDKDRLSGIGLGERFAHILSAMLKRSNYEVKALKWPADKTRISIAGYRRLLAVAQREGVLALAPMGIIRCDFKMWKLPRTFGPNLDFVNLALARVEVEGWLIDVVEQEGIVGLRGKGQRWALFYRGPESKGLKELSSAPVEEFGKTLTGAAATEALEDVIKQVKGARERITKKIPNTASRTSPPRGVCFSRDRYVFRVERSFDQWGEVEVINSDKAPHRFIVKSASEFNDIAAGFIGRGSVDEICELGPGEMKRVRFVVMAAHATRGAYRLPAHLYVMDGRATAADIPKFHDRTEVVIEVAQPGFEVEINKIAEDPYTLAQTYGAVNKGAAVTDLSIYPDDALKGAVTFSPVIDKFFLDAGMEAHFTVAPVLQEGFKKLEGRIIVSGNGTEKPVPISFALPEGKRVFTTDAGSRWMSSSLTTYCTNQGKGETRLGGPPEKCRERGLSPYQEPSEDEKKGWKDLKHLEPTLRKGVECFIKEVRKRGGKVEVTSGYRDREYQRHLREIKEKYERLKDKPECSHLLQQLLDHATKHWSQDTLKKGVPKVGLPEKSKHTFTKNGKPMAEAVDLVVYDKMGSKMKGTDEIAEKCGLHRPLWNPETEKGEYWHYEIKRSSHDGGTLADPEDAQAYLTARFALPHDRMVYRPHDTRIYLNGHLVGELLNTVPEGTYIFKVDPAIVNYQRPGEHVENIVSTKINGINRGHYIVANQFKLIVPLHDAKGMVVASSEEEAIEALRKSVLARSIINHQTPDIGIFANYLEVPSSPVPGQKVRLRLKVMNIGERISPPITISIYNHSRVSRQEEEDSAVHPLLQPLIDRIREYLPKKEAEREAVIELRKAAKDIHLDSIEPDHEVEVIAEVEYAEEITRLKIVAECDEDFDPDNNVQVVTFISHDTRSPLAGVDYLDVERAPVLERFFDVRAPEERPAPKDMGKEPPEKLEDIRREMEKLDKELSELMDIYAEECVDIPPFSESKKARRCREIERRMHQIYEEKSRLYKKEQQLQRK